MKAGLCKEAAVWKGNPGEIHEGNGQETSKDRKMKIRLTRPRKACVRSVYSSSFKHKWNNKGRGQKKKIPFYFTHGKTLEGWRKRRHQENQPSQHDQLAPTRMATIQIPKWMHTVNCSPWLHDAQQSLEDLAVQVTQSAGEDPARKRMSASHADRACQPWRRRSLRARVVTVKWLPTTRLLRRILRRLCCLCRGTAVSPITDGRPSMFEESFQLPAKKRTDMEKKKRWDQKEQNQRQFS